MIKNLIIKIIVVFAVVIASISCSKEEQANIEVSSQMVTVLNDNAGVKITVTSNVEWAASLTSNAGFYISPSKGVPGVTEVLIGASPNTTKEARKSDLVISGGGTSVTVELIQNSLVFSVSPASLLMDSIASTQTISIASNVSWSIKEEGLPKWIKSISPMSGTGDASVRITTLDNPNRFIQEHILDIQYSGTWYSLLLQQKAGANTPPSKATNLSPGDQTSGTSIMPVFKWDASADADGDEVYYTVKLSADGINWSSIDAQKNTSVSMAASYNVLKAYTNYYYKVVADDKYAAGAVESDIVSFTTGDIDAYADGAYTVYQKSTKSNPVKLVFSGDGYLPEHFRFGALFDQNLDEGIEGLFSIEPYKTYREYFSVYKVASYSRETGVSDQTKGIRKNTTFSATLTGGTGIECNYDKVFTYALKIDDIDQEDLYNTSISLIINANVYAGTCISYIDGRSIGMVPVSRASGNGTEFVNIVCHEYGGHGFGRLADEYTTYAAQLPEADKSRLLTWQASNYSLNVSPYENPAKVPWSKFIGMPDYYHVGVYSGAYYYQLGAYKSEFISCMVDNRMYFNTQSRYLIVERIMQVTGEPMTLSGFLAKDVKKVPVFTKSDYEISKFVPLAPPIMRLK